MPRKNERSQARASGESHYFTGKPCLHGHIAHRYTNNGQCSDCMREKLRRRYAEDPEKWRRRGAEYSKQRYAADPLAWSAKVKEWQAANPERVRAYKQANKAKRRCVTGEGASWSEVEKWKAAQPKVCYWCGVKCGDAFQVDHYIPLSKGGEHQVDNLVIACPSCNHRKSAKDPYQFAGTVGRLF